MAVTGDAEGAAIWIADALGPLGFANYRRIVDGRATKLSTCLDERARPRQLDAELGGVSRVMMTAGHCMRRLASE